MLSYLADGLTIGGILVLLVALVPIRRLIGQLSPGALRRSWLLLAGMIILFIGGYTSFLIITWHNQVDASGMVVPGIFFLGSWFVLMVNNLSLQTARDIQRISTLEQESITDPLMGIFNRRHLGRRLQEEMSRASRYGLPLSILLIDIDHFKQVNDSCGHIFGDQVLVKLGQIITNSVRQNDIVARFGGDEVMVITPNTPIAAAAKLAERIHEVTNSPGSFQLDSNSHPCTISLSIGVASYGPGVQDLQSFMLSVDRALYLAKARGRNRVEVAEPGAVENNPVV